MNPSTSALLTDLYELTMAQAYLEQGMDEPAVFEFFVRKLPPHRNFLVAAGLEQVGHAHLEGVGQLGDREQGGLSDARLDLPHVDARHARRPARGAAEGLRGDDP